MRRLPWPGLLLALALVLLFASLARWQYGRGAAKQAYLDDWAAAQLAPSRPLLEALSADAVALPQPVRGELQAADGARWVLLDNQRRGNEVGVRAYAWMRFDPARPLLLVDFGWAALGPHRKLPQLPAVPAQLAAEGLLLPWPGQAIRLAADAWPAAPAVLVTALDRTELAQQAGAPLIDGVLQLAPAADSGFVRESRALPNTLPPEKHYGYALQWGGLAVAVVAMAGWLLSRRTP